MDIVKEELDVQEERCQICEDTPWEGEHHIDTWLEEFTHLHVKLQAVTDSETNYGKWLRYMCHCCKQQLDDLWEFRLRCRAAYKKSLRESNMINFTITKECVEQSIAVLENVKSDTDYMEIIEYHEQDADVQGDMQVIEYEYESQLLEDIKVEGIVEIVQESPEKLQVQKTPLKRPRGRPRKNTKVQENKCKVPKERIMCELCADVSFTNMISLKRHVENIHMKIRNHICSTCGKGFYIKQQMLQHEQIHKEKRDQFQCGECGTLFTLKSNMWKHMRAIHLGKGRKKYTHVKHKVCSFCQKRFFNNTMLKNHERVHTGERPYKCDTCSMAFKSSSSLKKHMLTHVEREPFKCKYCGNSYKWRPTLEAHIRCHLGEKPYECPTCPKRFCTWKQWRYHKDRLCPNVP